MPCAAASSRSGRGSRWVRSPSSWSSGWPSTVGFDLTRPLFLGAGLVALAAIVVIWIRRAPPLSPRHARASLGLRALIVLLLTGALAGFELQTTPSAQSLIVVADLSASLQNSRDTELATVQRIIASRQGDNRAGLVSFARDAQVEVNASTDPQFNSFQNQPNPHYTDVASALQLAGSILPGDTRRHVVLVSDGRANLGDAVAEARLLHAEGVRVDTIAVNVPLGPEVLVDRLDAPRSCAGGKRRRRRRGHRQQHHDGSDGALVCRSQPRQHRPDAAQPR